MSQDDLTVLLRDGRSKHAALSGPMDEVVTNSTQYLSDDDNRAIAGYLLSLPGSESTKKAVPKAAKAQMENGHQLYARYCATCHGSNGEGADYAVPALKGNLTVNADNTLTLLRVVLEGGKTAVTQGHLPYSMPGYGWALSDQDAADVTNYIRGSFGNEAAPVTPDDVKDAREWQHNE
ncbi:putative diheme cytochrome c-553 [Cronobacter dublinensis 1210]|uniref:Diheme cytochrome c-553 n=2 Tax=Cronobacter dublinensis TaxID=413497 RepID=A0ABM9Q874_9ENTR|nr:putative diheme cytochrome c-553 [Cronobacter dublinensis 1210]